MSETKRAFEEMKQRLADKANRAPSDRFRTLIDEGLITPEGQVRRSTEEILDTLIGPLTE